MFRHFANSIKGGESMNNNPLITKSKEFALQIIKVCNQIKREKKETVLTNQLVRSGTNVGANIREAFYGHGTADFIAKLQIALKECAESQYWSGLVKRRDIDLL